jgi:4-amino-4-deoxy-L-arabinose transferase-like glycosyltransferase
VGLSIVDRTLVATGRRVLAVAGCVVLAFVVLFWRLGDATFWDPDEAHYAETSRELVRTGEWLAPMYNEEPFFDKPIFFHWLQGLAMRIGGETEGAARAVPALAALALVGVTAWVGARLLGASAARTGALILLGAPGTFALARYAILDSLFTAFLFGGISLVTVSALHGRLRLQYGGYVLLGAATCVKGPIAMVLCGVATLVAMALSADVRRRLLALHWVRGVAIVVAMSAPWLVYMLDRFGQAFVDGYFLNENIKLFSRAMYANQPPWHFYPGVAATGLLPWTWLAVGQALDIVRGIVSRKRIDDVVDILLWSWTIAIVGFFSASRFKLDHYIFPAAPALALICARAWARARQGGTANRGVRVAAALVGPTIVVAGLTVAFMAVRLLDLPGAFLVTPLALLALGLLATGRYGRPWAAPPEYPVAAIAAMGVIYASALFWIIPRMEELKVVPQVARWVSERATPGERIAAVHMNRWKPAYRYYVDRHVAFLDSDEEARRFYADPAPHYSVMTEERLRELRGAGVPLQVVYQQEGWWATSGRMLWRRPGGLTTFVVATSPGQVAPP